VTEVDQLYTDFLGRRSPVCAENQAPLTRLWSELEWQALWYSGSLGTAFRAVNGALVEIVRFGFWNRETGPDFVAAVIRIDGETLAGDIELDLSATDWDQHGHSQNENFERVVLHVFVNRPAVEFFTRTASNREVIQVVLPREFEITEKTLTPAIATIGRCQAHLQKLSDSAVNSLLEAAAQIRIRRKLAQLRRAIKVHGADEAIFQAIAVCLGYKRNKIPFLLLSQRLPLNRLRQDLEGVEALLFGVSGFLETRDDRATNTNQAASYRESLWRRWWRRRAEFSASLVPNKLWVLGGSRPANHPHRRVGALASLVTNWSKFRLTRPDLDAVQHWLVELSHPFWDFHFTLQSQRSSARLSLIGDSRAKEIVANVLFPLANLAAAPPWNEYKEIRADLGNRLLRVVGLRLFGSEQAAKPFQKFLYQQQGLLQIFEDFCLSDRSNCLDCQFPQLVDMYGRGSGGDGL
jgi:Protein of unknown function (DUF2851)